MPKVGMEPVRRRAVVEAAIGEVAEAGSLDVTVSQIARRAGMSSALVHHYFGSKDQVFLAAMRHVLSVYGRDVRAGLAQAVTPHQRAEAIVRASFEGENFQPDTVAAWLNFYTAAQTSQPAARLLAIYQRRIVSNLAHALRPTIGARATETAEAMAALIDGIYLRMGLGSGSPDPSRAAAMVMRLAERETVHARH
ncbi:MAG: transcriptional regulator BetI [Pseudomonadota bacterium]